MHALVIGADHVPPLHWRLGLALALIGIHLVVLYQMSQLRLQPRVSDPPEPVFVRFIEPPPAVVPPEPIAPPPLPQPVAKPKPAPKPKPVPPKPVAQPAPVPRPVEPPPVAVEPAFEPPPAPAQSTAPPIPPAAIAAAPAPPNRPREVSALAYARKPEPDYPRLSRRLAEQGAVVIRVEVDQHGQPKRAQITRSSGFPRLDESALNAVRAAVFRPHLEDGRAVAAVGLVTIEFKLEN